MLRKLNFGRFLTPFSPRKVLERMYMLRKWHFGCSKTSILRQFWPPESAKTLLLLAKSEIWTISDSILIQKSTKSLLYVAKTDGFNFLWTDRHTKPWGCYTDWTTRRFAAQIWNLQECIHDDNHLKHLSQNNLYKNRLLSEMIHENADCIWVSEVTLWIGHLQRLRVGNELAL